MSMSILKLSNQIFSPNLTQPRNDFVRIFHCGARLYQRVKLDSLVYPPHLQSSPYAAHPHIICYTALIVTTRIRIAGAALPSLFLHFFRTRNSVCLERARKGKYASYRSLAWRKKKKSVMPLYSICKNSDDNLFFHLLNLLHGKFKVRVSI